MKSCIEIRLVPNGRYMGFGIERMPCLPGIYSGTFIGIYFGWFAIFIWKYYE